MIYSLQVGELMANIFGDDSDEDGDGRDNGKSEDDPSAEKQDDDKRDSPDRERVEPYSS